MLFSPSDHRNAMISFNAVPAHCGGGGGGGGGDGGGFFLACEDFGRMFGHSFPACAFFF